MLLVSTILIITQHQSPELLSKAEYIIVDYLVIEIYCRERNLDATQPVSLETLMDVCGLLSIILIMKTKTTC